MSEEPWFETLETERLHEGFVTLDRLTVRQRLFRGETTGPLHREVMVTKPVAAVLLYDPVGDRVVMIEQARLPAEMMGFSAISCEIIGGLIDEGETPEAAAIREAKEEAGCDIQGELLPVCRMMTSPGNTAQDVQIFCGRVDPPQSGGLHGREDEHEDIRVVVIDFAELVRRLDAGGFENAITLVACYWFVRNIETVRARWRQT